MKYLKLYENKEYDMDYLDPFKEEDWDESEIDLDKYYFIKLDGKSKIQSGKLSEDDEVGGRYLLDEDGKRVLYIRNNLQKLYDHGYLLLKCRIESKSFAIASGEELINRVKEWHDKKQIKND